MRRSAFLHLTGLTAANQKNMIRRGVMPCCKEHTGGRIWNSYTLQQAIATLLALELSRAGLDQGAAAALVKPLEFRDWFRSALDVDHCDIWITVISFEFEDGPAPVDRQIAVMSPLAQLPVAKIGLTKFTVTDLEKNARNIVQVNFSLVVRTLAARAVSAGIDLDLEL